MVSFRGQFFQLINYFFFAWQHFVVGLPVVIGVNAHTRNQLFLFAVAAIRLFFAGDIFRTSAGDLVFTFGATRW